MASAGIRKRSAGDEVYMNPRKKAAHDHRVRNITIDYCRGPPALLAEIFKSQIEAAIPGVNVELNFMPLRFQIREGSRRFFRVEGEPVNHLYMCRDWRTDVVNNVVANRYLHDDHDH